MADHLEKVTKKLIEKHFKKAPQASAPQSSSNPKKPQQNIQQQINAKEEEK
jgi:hypothetical protein